MFRTATTALCLSLAALAASPAAARQVTLTTSLKNFGGNPAYLALYLTDAKGAYQGTLWLAGGNTRYWRHLTSWFRATGGSRSEVNGVTGASVGAGRTLKVTLDLADALIDAGYQIRIDTASEGMYEFPAEVSVPLTKAGSGQAVAGRGYIKSFQYSM